MTDHNREELIERATWALIDYDTDVVDRGVRDEHYRERRADVERAWAVFEQAHAPTADEREAQIQVVAEAFEKHEGAPSWQDDPVGRDAALRWHMRGFKDGLNARRTVQGEPTDAEVDAFKREWWAAKDEGDDGNKVLRGLRAAYEEGKKR